MNTMLNRRGFLGGLAAAIAAPYVVKSGILMPLRGELLVPRVVSYVEAFDPEWTRWVRVGRAVARAPLEASFGQAFLQKVYTDFRVVLDTEYAPKTAPADELLAERARRRYG